MKPFVLYFVALPHLIAAPALDAGEIHVPGDYPSVQDAINAASAGDTIIVQLASTGPLVIDKPLTIVGDPSLKLYSGSYPCVFGTWEHPVTLAGPGSGSVALVNVVAEKYPVLDCYDTPSPVVGTGFDELHIVGSSLQSPVSGMSGSGYGAPCISVDLPAVFITDSVVIGGYDNIDQCASGWAVPGLPGVENPNGVVVALDSEIRGGDGGLACFCCSSGPCPVLPLGLGPGGTGVVAKSLFAANSTIAGGTGSTIKLSPGYSPYEPGVVICGKDPDGLAAEVSELVLLPGIFQGSPVMHLGSSWNLSYLASGPLATLFFSLSPSAPYYLSGAGWAFLAPGSIVNLGPVPTGLAQTLTFPIPLEPLLVGMQPMFQMFDSGQGLTRPVASLIVP